MAWGQPTRNTKCTRCGTKGTCPCQREINAELAANAAAAPRTCTTVCKTVYKKPTACGLTIRGGVCPCPYCP